MHTVLLHHSLKIDRCGFPGGDAKQLITADAYIIEITSEKMRGYLSYPIADRLLPTKPHRL